MRWRLCFLPWRQIQFLIRSRIQRQAWVYIYMYMFLFDVSMQVVSLTFNVMGVVKECLFPRLDKCVFFVLMNSWKKRRRVALFISLVLLLLLFIMKLLEGYISLSLLYCPFNNFVSWYRKQFIAFSSHDIFNIFCTHKQTNKIVP